MLRSAAFVLRSALLSLLALSCTMACNDPSRSSDDPSDGATDAHATDAQATDAHATDAHATDAHATDALATDARPTDAADGTPPDAARPAECTPGERTCAENGPPAGITCGPDGRWAIAPCAAGEVCLGDGACVPDGATCDAGDRICLGDERPAECRPGEGWVDLPRCLPGWVCSGDGRCRDPACATRAERSYLGCEFLAVDLQNIAFAPFGATADAPLGVVLANADTALSTRVWVTEPDGAPAALIGEITVRPPLVAAGTPAVTVRSEVRDEGGAVVEAGFDRAHPVDIPPGGMAILLLPHHPYAESSIVRSDAWTITTDRPVAAYQFSPYCCNYSFTNDASLLLPIAALGTDYRFVGVPAWRDPQQPDPGDPNPIEGPGLAATLTVIGSERATRVTVTLPRGAAVEPDPAGRLRIAGNTVQFELDANEVAHLTTPPPGPGAPPRGVDLSGAHIAADAPVAVFSGHQCTYFPQEYSACDHLEEQLFPTDTWGTRFLLTPPRMRAPDPRLATEAIYWKFVARDPDTRIAFSVPFATLDSQPPGFVGVSDCADRLLDDRSFMLQPGETCEFGTRAPVAVSSDRPISVLGILSGQSTIGIAGAFGGAHAGDPSIFLVPPEYQFRRDYAFLTPTTYFVDLLTVVAPQGTALVLDGQPIDLAGAIAIPGSNQVYTHIELADGPHRISGDQPFGILVYAYDDWVSYAFTGGQNLIKR